MSWRPLSVEEARRHPRYGIGGWLYVFFGLLVFAVIADSVELSRHGLGSDRPAWLIGLSLAVYVAILAAGVRHWRGFPELAIAGTWLTGGLGRIFTEHASAPPIPGGDLDPRQVGLVAFVVFSLLLTWLLLASERVNVTYKRRCRTP